MKNIELRDDLKNEIDKNNNNINEIKEIISNSYESETYKLKRTKYWMVFLSVILCIVMVWNVSSRYVYLHSEIGKKENKSDNISLINYSLFNFKK